LGAELWRGKGLQEPTITPVAERLGHTPARVSSKERIGSNAELFDFVFGDGDGDVRIFNATAPTAGCAPAGSATRR
jgi:hypothetical protein